MTDSLSKEERDDICAHATDSTRWPWPMILRYEATCQVLEQEGERLRAALEKDEFVAAKEKPELRRWEEIVECVHGKPGKSFREALKELEQGALLSPIWYESSVNDIKIAGLEAALEECDAKMNDVLAELHGTQREGGNLPSDLECMELTITRAVDDVDAIIDLIGSALKKENSDGSRRRR